MDVAEWLRALGLEQYEATFRENDVDAALLPNLADDDVKKPGIANHQSAGKQKTGKIRKGNVHLKTTLVTAPVAVAKPQQPRPRPSLLFSQ
jgi:hypothetical protein